jgi:hypothetical protein
MIGAALVLVTATAGASDVQRFHAVFSGFNEVPPILSEGKATLDLTLDRKAKTLTFTLTYSNLSSSVIQSHIHFGKVHVNGSVVVFFCSNATGAPTPNTCPVNGGTVTGTLTASDVLSVPGQNISAGDFDAIEDALESNTAYANIHTANFPAGEIRGQVHGGGDRDDD